MTIPPVDSFAGGFTLNLYLDKKLKSFYTTKKEVKYLTILLKEVLMAEIKPFSSIRPVKEMAEKVAALPYDVMNREEAEAIVENNPFSFLRVQRAEVELPSSISPYHPDVYRKAADNFKDLIDKGILIKEQENFLYIYQLESRGRYQTGLVICASIDDYLNGVIKKHEHTREDKEQDRINHVMHCNANTGPILLFHKESKDVENIINTWVESNQPLFNFTTGDKVSHRVWIIDDSSTIKTIVDKFSEIDYLYIADGHHRCEAAAKVALMKRKNGYSGDEEFNYFLGVVFPHSHLHIMDYNRVVKDLNGLNHHEFLNKIREKFEVGEWQGEGPYRPERKHTFGMFLEDRWFRLEAVDGNWDEKDAVACLDVSILQNNLLEPVLGIENPRNDDRIEFVGGIRGLEELEKRVRGGMAVAFSLYPTSIEELMAVADQEKVMPPKSTWFEPKLRSGLFIHRLE